MLVLLAAASFAGAADEALETARQEAQQAYGQRIEAAAQTDVASDDLALAEELMAAAGEADRSAAERFAFADLAVSITSPLGTESGCNTAREAMALAESILPYSPAARALREWQIETGRLNRLQRNLADLEAVIPVAGAAAEAGLVYVGILLADNGETDSASAALREVRALANRYKLDSISLELPAMEERLKRAADRRKRIAGAELKLQQAQQQSNEAAIATARRELADAYISFDGNLLLAAQYTDGTGHVLEQALKVVVAVQAGEVVDDRDRILESVVALREYMANLDGPALTRVGEHAIALCDAYLAGAVDGSERVKAELHKMQINKLMGNGPADVMLGKLAEAYEAPLHCKLQLINDNLVRVSYNFEDPRQLEDWNIHQHQWQVAAALVQTGQSDNRPASIATRLRFRADQPVSVSLRANAFDQIGVALAYHDWGKSNSTTSYRIFFRGLDIGRHGQRGGADGLELISSRDVHRWQDNTRVLDSGTVYDIQLTIDGAGGMTWRINDVLVHEYSPGPGDAVATDGYVTVQLLAQNASTMNPTAYDDVVIEGCVLPTPNWRPGED